MLNKTILKNILRTHTPLLHKLSYDSLLILLFFFVLVLLAEGLLPGIISQRIGLYGLVMLICANLFFTLTLTNRLALKEKYSVPPKTLWLVFGILLLLIFNALLSLPLGLNLFLLALSGAAIFYIFRVFQEKP